MNEHDRITALKNCVGVCELLERLSRHLATEIPVECDQRSVQKYFAEAEIAFDLAHSLQRGMNYFSSRCEFSDQDSEFVNDVQKLLRIYLASIFERIERFKEQRLVPVKIDIRGSLQYIADEAGKLGKGASSLRNRGNSLLNPLPRTFQPLTISSTS